jgi:hypothetical protein
MELIKSTNADINYLAKIINITEFSNHPNPEVTKLKVATVDGYRVIVSVDSPTGLYVYFPTLSTINPDFLKFTNLYRHSNLNADTSKKGFFEDNGKVTAIKLKGLVSEGFLIEYKILLEWLQNYTTISDYESSKDENKEFDTIEFKGGSIWICKKARNQVQVSKFKEVKDSGGFDLLLDGQFRLHYQTVLIKKCPYVVNYDDIVSITEKIHGTSGVSAYLLCKSKLSWRDKLINWLSNTIGDWCINWRSYEYLYSSKNVIKNRYQGVEETCDIWKYAHEYVKDKLWKGMSLYYEIVGYLPNGNFIQKNYDYGCCPPKTDENGKVSFEPEINFKVRVYRITLTNEDGKVHEFSAKEVQQWCKNNGLIPVTEYYYGEAGKLTWGMNGYDDNLSYCENFINFLTNNKDFYMEEPSPSCNNKVPHEGLVIKVENMRSEAFKLKCFAFVKQELADNSVNIEDNA